MVEAVRSRSEVISGRINTLEQVVILARRFPSVTSSNELAWILKHGLAVEAYRRTHQITQHVPGRDHFDADIALFTKDPAYWEFIDWIGGGLELNPFGESGLLITFGDVLLNTAREVTIMGTELICMHPALVVLHKVTDTRVFRYKDLVDIRILKLLMISSSSIEHEWEWVADQGLRFLKNAFLERRGRERWELFKQNPHLLI